VTGQQTELQRMSDDNEIRVDVFSKIERRDKANLSVRMWSQEP
jgi:hypothetical protein